MKFTKLVASVAIIAFAANAGAYTDGTLRRGGEVKVAQNDVSAKEVNININTNSAAQTQQATVQQPTTVVEAAPVTESKAEVMRKARQEAEVGTEQKIVEKLEESRLQEERARADRLFGNKLDAQPAAAAAAPKEEKAAAPAPAPVAEKATQVTIEKVEIIQPAPVAPVEKAEPVAETKAELKAEKSEPTATKWYVSGLAGNLSYQASNIKSNYGLGVAVGTILDDRIGIELSYFYSNHKIDDINFSSIYHKLDQNDVSLAGKYYILTGKLKPYVGGQVSYIDRKYQDRMYANNYGWGGYPYGADTSNAANTQSVNMGVLAGVDFQASDRFIIGLGLDYNFNVMTMNEIDANNYYYQDPYNGTWQKLNNYKQLEKINFYAIKANAKFTF